MAGHVVNSSTEFESPKPIRSWLMSYDVRRWPPLTMLLEPLRIRRITWPVRRGKFSPNIWNLWPRFVYSLCNSHGSTIKVNWVICQNSVRPCVKDERDVCACAKSRDLSVGGRKLLHFWNLRPRYTYSQYNVYGATMTIKGRLYCTCSMLKAFSSQNVQVPSKKGPKMAVLGAKGGVKLIFWFRLLTYFASKSFWASWL